MVQHITVITNVVCNACLTDSFMISLNNGGWRAIYHLLPVKSRQSMHTGRSPALRLNTRYAPLTRAIGQMIALIS